MMRFNLYYIDPLGHRRSAEDLTINEAGEVAMRILAHGGEITSIIDRNKD